MSTSNTDQTNNVLVEAIDTRASEGIRTDGPAYARLTDKQKFWLKIYLTTGDHIRTAKQAGYNKQQASVIVKSPRIQAAIAEQRPAPEVRTQASPDEVTRMLLIEAQRPENTGNARVTAQKALADILGMTGGGGSREDGALPKFLEGIARSVAQGAFAGSLAASRAGAGGSVVAVEALPVGEVAETVSVDPVAPVGSGVPVPVDGEALADTLSSSSSSSSSSANLPF